MRATLVVPDRDPAAPSGGDVYDARVAAHWPDELRVCRAPGAWPRPTGADRATLARLLSDLGRGPVLLDGLVASTVPDLVEDSARARRTVVLVHSTLSAGSGASGTEAAELDALEQRALQAADLVVATSGWSAADLRRRYGIEGIAVARPGVDPAPVAPGTAADDEQLSLPPGPPVGADASVAPQLLTLGALTPGKNHAAVLDALARLRDLAWELTIAGPAPDPGFADRLRSRASDLGVAERVSWPGVLDGAALERAWASADLVVHPSRSETWGLVVTEAHARGIPAVVARGTGAAEALTWLPGPPAAGREVEAWPGAAVDVDDRDELRDVLHRWFTDRATRRAWRSAALARRDRLPGWDETARVLRDALAGDLCG